MPDSEANRGKQDGPLFTDKPAKSSKVTIAEIGELRKVFEDSRLAKWVVWAGIGGMVELARLLYDIARYVHEKGF